MKRGLLFLLIAVAVLLSGCAAISGNHEEPLKQGKLFFNGSSFEGYKVATDMNIKEEDLARLLILLGNREVFETTFDLYWAYSCRTDIDKGMKDILEQRISKQMIINYMGEKEQNSHDYYLKIHDLHDMNCNNLYSLTSELK